MLRREKVRLSLAPSASCLSVCSASVVLTSASVPTEFDLAALFFGFTLSSFTTMAFTVDVGSLSLDSNAAPVPFADAFDYAQGGMSRRIFK